MSNYPLIPLNKQRTLFMCQHALYSDEYARSMCDLFVSDEFIRDERNNMHRRYRLHAMKPHSVEMALAYDIQCPKCGHLLKQVGRSLDYHELGLYKCPICDRD